MLVRGLYDVTLILPFHSYTADISSFMFRDFKLGICIYILSFYKVSPRYIGNMYVLRELTYPPIMDVIQVTKGVIHLRCHYYGMISLYEYLMLC